MVWGLIKNLNGEGFNYYSFMINAKKFMSMFRVIPLRGYGPLPWACKKTLNKKTKKKKQKNQNIDGPLNPKKNPIKKRSP